MVLLKPRNEKKKYRITTKYKDFSAREFRTLNIISESQPLNYQNHVYPDHLKQSINTMAFISLNTDTTIILEHNKDAILNITDAHLLYTVY